MRASPARPTRERRLECALKRALHGPVSQNSTANIFVEVNVDLGEPELLDGKIFHQQLWQPPVVIATGIPRKEVIQPQLPLRLPCYDFTPIINPTFDGCLPCGLAHRLRVLPTFVV